MQKNRTAPTAAAAAWRGALKSSTALAGVRRLAPPALVAGALLAAASGAQANPQGGQVVAGSATIVQSAATPNQLTIQQSSQSAILNWQSFSIGYGQRVVFQQPDASASALNRVTGNQASTIAGQLTANGQVMIVNPNGVLITPTGQVNVAGFVATTSDVSDRNFMAGQYVFDRPGAAGASVVNQGRVTVAEGGLAAFVAPRVENAGYIEARLGKVTLASGSRFTVDLYGDNLVKLAVDDRTAAQIAGPLVDNSGKIMADGGTVTLSVAAAQSIVENLINVGGTIQARTAAMQNGKIVLSGAGGTVSVSGTLDASGKSAGQTGGTVAVLGGAVDLAAGATLDASGAAGGGTVLVGGDFHGTGPDPDAATTAVAAGATIDASATAAGNGGTVAVWSNQATSFAGTVLARGGPGGGNGGFVETSSGGSLKVAPAAFVDTRAPAGQGGLWLLDPTNFTISPTGDETGATLAAALLGGNITVNADNDLTIADTVDTSASSTPANLTLQAGRSIVFGASANLRLAGSLTATANDSADLGATLADRGAGAGSITMAAGATINTSFDPAAGITLAVGASAANSGGTGIDFLPGTIGLASLTTAGGAVTVTGNVVLAGNASVSTASGGGANIGFFGTIDASSAGAQTLTLNAGSGTVMLGGAVGTTALGALSVTSGGSLTIGSSVTVSGGALSLTATAGSITVSAPVDAGTGGSIALAAHGNLDVEAAVGATTTGTIALTADKDGTGTAGTLTVNGAVGNAAAGAVSLSGYAIALTAPVDGGSVLTIAPSTAAADVGLGSGANANVAFDLTQAAIGEIGGDFTRVSIATTGGTILVDNGATPLLFGNPVTLGNVIELFGSAGGGIATSGKALTLAGPVTVAASGLALDTTNAGGTGTGANITLASTLDDSVAGQDSLTVTAGSTGIVAVQGNVGGGTPIAALTLSDATLQIGANVNVTLAGGAFGETGATVLIGNGANPTATIIDTSAAGGADLAFNGSVTGSSAGKQALTLTTGTGGTVTLGGAIGTTALGALSVTSGGGFTIGSAVTVSGGALSLTATAGSLTVSAPVSAPAIALAAHGNLDIEAAVGAAATGTITLMADKDGTGTAGTLTVNGAVGNASAGAVSLSGHAIALTAAVDGGNTLTIAPSTAAANVGLGSGTNANLAFNLTQAEIAEIGSGFTAVSIVTTGGTVLVDNGATPLLFANPVTLGDAIELFGGVGGGLATSGKALTLAGPVILGASGLLLDTTDNGGASAGAAITLAGTVDSTAGTHEALTVKAGSAGIVALDGNVGGITPLGAFTLTDASLQIGANVNVTLASGAFSETGATVLAADGGNPTATTIDTSSGNASMLFNGAVDGGGAGLQALTLKAGSGAVTLDGNVGGNTPLGATTLTDGTLTLAASVGVTTAAGAFSETGTTKFLGSSTVDTTSGAPDGAAIAFHGGVSGTAVTLISGDAGVITLAGNVTTSAGQSYEGAVSLGAGLTLTDTGGSAIAFADTLAGGSHALSVIDDQAPSFGGAVSGLASITLAPATAGRTIAVGDSSAAALGAGQTHYDFNTSLGNLENGAVSGAVTIGNTNSATVTMTQWSPILSLALVNGGTAGIAITGAYDGSGSLNLNSGSGGIALGADVTTGAAQSYHEAVTLDASVTLTDSGGSTIHFFSTVDGDLAANQRALTLSTPVGGALIFGGNVGSAQALGSLVANSGTVSLGGNVVVTGTADLSGSTSITLAAASVTIDGFANLAPVLGANDALTIAGGTGTVTLAGAGTNGSPLASLTVTTSGELVLGGNVVAKGAVDFSTVGTVALNAAAITIDTTDNGAAAGAAIDTGALVEGNPVTGALTLRSGSGAITLATVGTVDFPVGGLAATGGTVTLNGNIVSTGAVNLAGAAGVTLAATPLLIDTTDNGLAAGAAISLAAVTGAGNALELQSGTGTVTLAAVGSNASPVNGLTVGGGQATLDGTIVSTAAVDFSNASGVTFGAALLIDTTDNALAAGAAILLPAVQGTGSQALTLHAGSGSVSLQAVGSDAFPVGGLAILGGAVTLGGNIVAAGAVDLSGTTGLTLAAATVAIDTTNNGAGTGATIKLPAVAGADDAFQLMSGTGAISLGAVGTALSPVDGLVATGGPVTLAGNIVSAGPVDLSGTTGVTLAAASVTIDTTADASAGIALAAVTGNNDALILAGGTLDAAAITLAKVGTNASPVSGLTVTGSIATLNGGIVSTGTVDLSGLAQLTLGASLTIDTTDNGNAAGAAILVPMALGSGSQVLTLHSGIGAVSLQAAGTDASPLGGLAATGGPVTLAGNVVTRGAVDLSGAAGVTLAASPVLIDTTDGGTGTGAQIKLAAVTGNGDALDLTSGGGTIQLAAVGSDAAPVGAFTAAGGTVKLGADIVSTGAVDLGAASAVALNAASVLIDTTDNGGAAGAAIRLAAVTGNDDALVLAAGTGAITLAAVGSNASPVSGLTVSGGALTLGGNIVTTGTLDLTNLAQVTLGASLTIDTTDNGNAAGANISLPGILGSGTQVLILHSGAGEVSLAAVGSAAAPVGGLAATGGEVTLAGTIVSTGTVDLSAAAGVALGAATVLIDTTDNGAGNGAAIKLAAVTGNLDALVLSSGTGAIALAAVGTPLSPVQSFSVTGGLVTLAGDIDSEGLADAIDLSGAAGLTLAAPTVSISADNVTLIGREPSFVPEIKLPPVMGGGNALNLTTGFNGIVIAGVGTNASPVSALTVSGDAAMLTGNVVSTGAVNFSLVFSLTLPSASLIDTTDNGAASGAAINLPGIAGSGGLTVHAGAGAVTFGSVSLAGQLVMQASQATLQGDSIDAQDGIDLSGVGQLILASPDTSIGTSNAAITLPPVVSQSSPDVSLSLASGTGSIALSSVGTSLAPISTLQIQSAGQVTLGGNIFADGHGDNGFGVDLSAAAGVTPGVANVTIDTSAGTATAIALAAVTGNGKGLTLVTDAAGSVTLAGVGTNASPIHSLTLATPSLTLTGNIVANGPLDLTGADEAILGAALAIDTTDNGATGGAALTLPTVLGSGTQVLSLRAGGGAISLGTAGTAANPLGGLTVLSGAVTLAGNIVSTGTVDLGGASGVTLAGSALIDTTQGGVIPAGAAIALPGVTGGGNDLQLNAGSSGALTTGALSGIGTLELVNAGSANFGAIAANTVQIDGAAGSVAFGGAVNAGAVSAGAGSYAIAFDGAVNVTGAATMANSGGLTLGAGGTSLTFTGGIAAAEPATLNGTILAAGGAVTLGAVTLAGNSAIDTTGTGSDPAGGVIDLASVAGNSHNLSLNAGTVGTIDVTGDMTGLATFTLVNSASANFAGALAANAIAFQNTGTSIAVGGTVTAASIATAAEPYALALGGNAAIADATSFINTGGVSLGSSGTGQLYSGGLVSTASTTTLEGTVATAGHPASFGPVLLGAAAVVDSTNGGAAAGADIAFQSTVDGTFGLAVAAGSGTISLGGNLGATTPLGALSLSGAALNLPFNLSILTAGGAVGIDAGPLVLPGGHTATLTTIATTGNNSPGANITIAQTIDGSFAGMQALTLAAGDGTIALPANLGGTTALGALTFTDAILQLGGDRYMTLNAPISETGATTVAAVSVIIAAEPTVIDQGVIITGGNSPGAAIMFGSVTNANSLVTFDPGSSGSVRVDGGMLNGIAILQGNGSLMSSVNVGSASLGGSGIGEGDTIGGVSGQQAAQRAFIRPGGNWLINNSSVITDDPALAGLSDAFLNSEGVSTALALETQIQQLLNRGDTGETAAQEAFDQYPDRSGYAVDPFRQRYNIIGVAHENVGGFENVSYIQDGFWEGLLK